MKRKLLILSTGFWLLTPPLSVTACTINSNINDDDYHPSDDSVNLSDCENLFTNDDLTYSYLTVTKEMVTSKISGILKYHVRTIEENDYSITFSSKNGEPVDDINVVNNYDIFLVASKDSKHLKGNLVLDLSIIDDRTDIGQIDYDANNWYLSSRNTIADLFMKFEMAIYLVVQDARYKLGNFLNIEIQYKDTVYTNADRNSDQVLDVSDSYIISATTESQNIDNSFIVGSLRNLAISATDERQTVANLSNQIFSEYHPDNLNDNGKTLHNGIRGIINNLYTLDSTTQSDFEIRINSSDGWLENDESKLANLSYQITIDATNSKYLKGINSNLTIEIVDRVINLEKLVIDTTVITPDLAMQAKTLKSDILRQISIAASFPGAERYLIVNLTQNGSNIVDDDQYLDPINVQINVVPDSTIKIQYFGGKLNLNLSVLDNRIDLADSTMAAAINKAILSIGYSILNTLNDVKLFILSAIKELVQETNPNVNQNIVLGDLDITLDDYSNDTDYLNESSNVPLKIKANTTSRYIKNELNLINININYVKEKGSFITIPMTPIEFIDYDGSANLHVMTQIDDTTIVVYHQDLAAVKYSIEYSQETNIILDYKVSEDGAHDFWVMQTKIDDTKSQIDYYIDNEVVATNVFEASRIIASINKYSQSLYVRPDITEEHDGVGNLYKINPNEEEIIQIDLSQISELPFEIDMIRSSQSSSQEYIQSKNLIFSITEDINGSEPIIEQYDISNDYFFDYDDQNNIYQLRKDGLYRNDELINSVSPNPNLLYDIDVYNYKFISNLTVDQDNNFYYLYRDNVNRRYSIVKNQEVVFTVTDQDGLSQYLKVSLDGIWELTIGSKIYTNEK